MRRILHVASAILLIAGTAEAAETIKGTELTALLGHGKDLILGGPGKGYAGSLALSADGKGKGQIKLDNGDVILIEGVWVISKDKFCRTWKGGRDAGKQICESWAKTGPKSVEAMVGNKDLGSNSWN
jgi:hypothetical protein